MTRQYNDYFIISDKNISTFEKTSILEIKKVILNHFEELKVDFNYEVCSIQKSKLSCPLFCTKRYNDILPTNFIFLSIVDYNYWCQVVYQLSHEITHCFIYSNNYSVNNKASWIEETICEAMSFYFLNYFYKNWRLCGLYQRNSNYFKFFNNYLNYIIIKKGNGRLDGCKSLQELKEIEKSCQENREDRLENSKQLYKLINKSNIVGLIKYRDYIIDNTLLLDSKRYLNDFPNNSAVKYLCDIQKSIIENDYIHI